MTHTPAHSAALWAYEQSGETEGLVATGLASPEIAGALADHADEFEAWELMVQEKQEAIDRLLDELADIRDEALSSRSTLSADDAFATLKKIAKWADNRIMAEEE